MLIRDAGVDDLPSILAIHNDAILHSVAIWTDEPVDLAERAGWFESHRRNGFPVLVAVSEPGDGSGAGEGAPEPRPDEVLGYASLGSWHTKTGFRHTVEDTIYVRPDRAGRGIGRALLGALLQLARDGGYHVVVADIEASNAASIRLHESFGFEIAGTVREVGTKFGHWLDLTTMRLSLD